MTRSACLKPGPWAEERVVVDEGPFGLQKVVLFKKPFYKPWVCRVDTVRRSRTVLRVCSEKATNDDAAAETQVANAFWNPEIAGADIEEAKKFLFNLATVAYEGE